LAERHRALADLSAMRRRLAAVALLLGACAAAAQAQQPRLAEPSRADSLLAQGRLAAAEDALYAAADAKPRDPGARGALAAYLASRGRFTQRFGADPSRVRLARAAIEPYAKSAGAGAEVSVPLTPSRDPRSLGAIPVRQGRGAAERFTAFIDPNVSGVTMGREVARRFGFERGRPLAELWIGERRRGRDSHRSRCAVESPADLR